MSTLDDIFAEMKEDMKFDQTELGREALRINELFQKYLRLYVSSKLEVDRMQLTLSKLIERRTAYYKGEATAEEYKKNPFNEKVKTNHEMQVRLDGDEQIIAAKRNILINEQKVEIYSQCLEYIKRNRGFEIKNAIEDEKFKNGAY